MIQWSGLDPIYAKIGISFGDGMELVHDLSGSAGVRNIDCINSSLEWVNVIYNLSSTGSEDVITTVVQPSSTSVFFQPSSTVPEMVLSSLQEASNSVTMAVTTFTDPGGSSTNGGAVLATVSDDDVTVVEQTPTLSPCK